MTDNIKKINAILDILPQMQCKKCKYDDCESYSRAIVEDGEETDRCEPGSESTRILIEDIKKVILKSHHKILIIKLLIFISSTALVVLFVLKSAR